MKSDLSFLLNCSLQQLYNNKIPKGIVGQFLEGIRISTEFRKQCGHLLEMNSIVKIWVD